MKETIFLVEDDPTIQEIVSEKLLREGYQVENFETAEKVAEKKEKANLYIIDVLLAGSMDGMELCQILRRQDPHVPILILSALSDPAQRVEGLRSGADDYLTKPFEMEELLLRVRGMFKRRSWYSALPGNSSTFQWGKNSVNFASFQATVSGKTFNLGEKECMILKLLVEKKGQVVTRDEILDSVWGYHAYPTSRTVDNFISKLRKIFEPEPNQPKYIHSVRGVGYKFTE